MYAKTLLAAALAALTLTACGDKFNVSATCDVTVTSSGSKDGQVVPTKVEQQKLKLVINRDHNGTLNFNDEEYTDIEGRQTSRDIVVADQGEMEIPVEGGTFRSHSRTVYNRKTGQIVQESGFSEPASAKGPAVTFEQTAGGTCK